MGELLCRLGRAHEGLLVLDLRRTGFNDLRRRIDLVRAFWPCGKTAAEDRAAVAAPLRVMLPPKHPHVTRNIVRKSHSTKKKKRERAKVTRSWCLRIGSCVFSMCFVREKRPECVSTMYVGQTKRFAFSSLSASQLNAGQRVQSATIGNKKRRKGKEERRKAKKKKEKTTALSTLAYWRSVCGSLKKHPHFDTDRQTKKQAIAIRAFLENNEFSKQVASAHLYRDSEIHITLDSAP